MATKSEFWLLIHCAASALDQEGHTPAEQLANTKASLLSMMPVARDEVTKAFRRLFSIMEGTV
jgi:hypothetical protein